jgi:hypothetical protein
MNSFQEYGYLTVPELLNDETVALFTQYALFMESKEFTPETGQSAQVPGAHSSYGDPFAEALLLYAHESMEQLTGLRLHPTYSYYRVYRNGSTLKPHRDRESCEISATLCFAYEYNKSGYEWPIIVDGVEVVMEPGDAVIYKGCDIEHSRNTLEAGENAFHVQAFLHYVDADGPYAENKYDRRKHLATPPAIAEMPPKRKYIFRTND